MKAFHKITAVSLAIVFLLSSLGFTVSKIDCLQSCEEKASLYTLDDCCAEEESSQKCHEETKDLTDTYFSYITNADCCDIQTTSFDVNDFQSAPKNNIPAASYIILPVAQNYLANSITTHSFKKNNLDYPPILPHGRTLLSFISILII